MKLLYKIYMSAAALCSVAFNGAATGNEAFNRVVNEVLANNPGLKARSAEFRSMKLTDAADNRLEAPEVEFEHQWGQDGIGNKWAVGVSQSFDWPGLYKARGEANRLSSEAYSASYAGYVADLTLEVKQLLVDMVALRLSRDATVRQMENLASLHALTSRAFESGEATVLEMNKLELQRFSMESKLATLDAGYVALSGQLAALNGGVAPDVSGIDAYPDGVLLAEEEYISLMEKGDATLESMRRDIERRKAGVKVESMKRYPGFSLGYVHNVELGEHFNGLRVGVSLPFLSGNSRHKSAEAMVQSADYEYEAFKMRRQAEVTADYRTAVSLWKRVEGRTRLFSGDSYLSTLRKALDGGQMTLMDYLYESNLYIESQQEYFDLLARYHKLLISQD